MSNFNSLPAETTPLLTDKVFTARGNAAGAERAPTFQTIADNVLQANLANSILSIGSSLPGVTNIEQFTDDIPHVPPGQYLPIGYIRLIGSGLTIAAFSFFLRLADADGKTIKSYTYSLQAQTGVDGTVAYLPIFPDLIMSAVEATKWGVRSSVAPGVGDLTAQINLNAIFAITVVSP
jgi:hypothetical protein